MTLPLIAFATALGAVCVSTVDQSAKHRWITCTSEQLNSLMEHERMQESWSEPKTLVEQSFTACSKDFDAMKADLPKGQFRKIFRDWRRTLLRSADADFKFRVVSVF